MKSFFKILPLVLIAIFFLCSCTKNNEKKEIKQTKSYATRSADIGHKAAQMIKAPIDSAQGVVDKENQRTKEYEKKLNGD